MKIMSYRDFEFNPMIQDFVFERFDLIYHLYNWAKDVIHEAKLNTRVKKYGTISACCLSFYGTMVNNRIII
jgi:hypothetical protein